ncbi:DUF1631 family protein [Candidatus Vondammii sp. HM_W22]|uniref:DUF1631 family protein n=1 Tax=Candidatus Vondammii sp. HM_W22 TaxID=2687299 RepID=UPI001F12D155|nr:DUF1631 family protein [Candidatus Vondammii sp. HM_W22]
MDDLFECLDDILYSLADKAGSNQSQLLYFDSMRELRKEREGIENRFNQSLLEGYDQFWKSGPRPRFSDPAGAPQPGDEFSLVEDYDLEEGLAVDSMVSKGENAYFRDLYALDQRFSYLLNGLQVAGCRLQVAGCRLQGQEIPYPLLSSAEYSKLQLPKYLSNCRSS